MEFSRIELMLAGSDDETKEFMDFLSRNMPSWEKRFGVEIMGKRAKRINGEKRDKLIAIVKKREEQARQAAA